MKKNLLLIATACILAAACDKTPDFVPELSVSILGTEVVEGTPGNVDLDHRGGFANVKVTCNTTWTPSCTESWVVLNPSETALKITADANPQFSVRTATIRITADKYANCFREILVSQASDTPTITIKPSSIEFTKDGGDQETTVTSNCDWTAASSNQAFTVAPASGKAGTTTIKVTAGKNSSTSEVNATINFTSSVGATATLAVKQRANLTGYYVENGINRGMGITIDGKMWAPVNCGYSEPQAGVEGNGNLYGKYYQWGRKVGFAYNDEGANIDSGSRNNVNGPVKSIADAKDEEFYKNSPNWLETKINDLWNKGTEAAPVKTEYDPCPEGWRVPTETEMLALVKNNSGNVLEGSIHGRWCTGSSAYAENLPKIFLPLAGDIAQGSNSELRDDSGFYWTSTVRTGDGNNPNVAIQIYLKGWVGMNDWTDQRARAYPIRCIAE